MNNLSETEIKEKLIKYLSKKGITLISTYSNLVWNYEPHYSKFIITLNFNHIEDNKLVIRYHTNEYSLNGLSRKRTSITNIFCNNVYKNLICMKSRLDVIANDCKYNIDSKNKYCTELEQHFSEIHKNGVYVSINDSRDHKIITINGRDSFEKYSTYQITYKDNKYYLNSKVSYFDEVLC